MITVFFVIVYCLSLVVRCFFPYCYQVDTVLFICALSLLSLFLLLSSGVFVCTVPCQFSANKSSDMTSNNNHDDNNSNNYNDNDNAHH